MHLCVSTSIIIVLPCTTLKHSNPGKSGINITYMYMCVCSDARFATCRR